MNVVVSGAAGFVGSHIVEALLASPHGFDVVAIDNLQTGKRANLPGDHPRLRFVLNDVNLCHDELARADVVVHAAGYADVSRNWEPGERYAQWVQNAGVTREVLDHTKQGARFILLSTCAVYPSGSEARDPQTFDELTLPRATSPYAAAKLAAEALVEAYHERRRVRGVTLRLVSAVGARYWHGHIADFVAQATRGGAVTPLDNGWKRRSIIHVEDIADQVAELCDPDCVLWPVINVTGPYRWSWWDTIALMRAMRPNKPFDVKAEDRAGGWTGDARKLVVSSIRSQRDNPRSIVDGVAKALHSLGW